ncbi:hypothetical protein Cgig2_026584 [Carnegiea gigantea]|uniref:Uncharacterized protein n=1 Tax=Carnegiea gigantea TaxID=171969 RepID=A0A9Q1KIU8_9CARY|nr:hypothetical protein Cgig2_026584 [Carnegiea gigantea]
MSPPSQKQYRDYEMVDVVAEIEPLLSKFNLNCGIRGLHMVACFDMAEHFGGDTSWLAKEARTAINCLERLISICDLAENRDKETVARFSGMFPSYLTDFVAEDKKFAAETIPCSKEFDNERVRTFMHFGAHAKVLKLCLGVFISPNPDWIRRGWTKDRLKEKVRTEDRTE